MAISCLSARWARLALSCLVLAAACSSEPDEASEGTDGGDGTSTTTTTVEPDERLEAECSGRTRHVLVIGIDGLRPDAMEAADTPVLDSIAASGTSTMTAHAGGELGADSEQPTNSGPGWSSILTGVWTDKHLVVDNAFTTQNFEEYPHFFTRLREVDPDARLVSAVHWIPISFIVDDADVDTVGDDRTVTDDVIGELTGDDPTVVFVHLDDVDGAGHASTYAPGVPEYEAAIEVVDGLAGEMVDAVESRSTRSEECWATVVVTDHGGSGSGHGGQSPEERTIPLLVAGDGIAVDEVAEGPGHVVVPSTVMAYLGLPIDPAWGWEGQPFGVPG